MRSFVESFNSAIEGVIYVLKTQKNMRFHFIAAGCVLTAGVLLHFSVIEFAVLSLSITFVLVSEMFNTAIELTIDMVKESFHSLARIIKDVSAGCVLISTINAVGVGYFLFIKPIIRGGFADRVLSLKQTPCHLIFISLIVVMLLVVLGKVFFHKGTPMRGGMPSGHTAVAFSIWIITALSGASDLVLVMVFFMAVLVARGRLTSAIHNIWEVIAGAALGMITTLLVFRVLG